MKNILFELRAEPKFKMLVFKEGATMLSPEQHTEKWRLFRAAVPSYAPNTMAPLRIRPGCQRQTILHATLYDNPNGNAGRLYYACRNHVNGFACFADMRGCQSGNPGCDCRTIVEHQMSGTHGIAKVPIWGDSKVGRSLCLDRYSKRCKVFCVSNIDPTVSLMLIRYIYYT